MSVYKGHPRDGKKRMFDYVTRKVAHLRRMGLVAKQDGGYGRNGGACPDWLRKMQIDGEA